MVNGDKVIGYYKVDLTKNAQYVNKRVADYFNERIGIKSLTDSIQEHGNGCILLMNFYFDFQRFVRELSENSDYNERGERGISKGALNAIIHELNAERNEYSMDYLSYSACMACINGLIFESVEKLNCCIEYVMNGLSIDYTFRKYEYIWTNKVDDGHMCVYSRMNYE